jgi:signal transduction histidine kinase
MNKSLSILARRYTAALRRYRADEQEAVLEEAYELGRSAVAHGLGVLDMARNHHQALAKILAPPLTQENDSCALRAAETFFLQSLSPFEVTHRGFRATNLKLEQLIQTLKGRNLELARMNCELEREIKERKRTEQALRASERQLRELFHDARHMQESLRNLSNQVLHAQEEERKSISRELHDQVGQALTAISVNLAVLRRNGLPDSDAFHRKIADTQSLLQQTMQSVHHFARELRPAMLDELGLLPALRSQLRAFAERTGLQVHFCASPMAERLDGDQKTVVFRVAQESLTNVAKHARASRVQVTIRRLRGAIRMDIRDNGKSFRVHVPSSASRRKRLGLLGMQERVRLVNGKFAVLPKPGKGTTVRVEIPFTPAGAQTPPRRDTTRARATTCSPPKL